MDELLHALRIKGRASAEELARALDVPAATVDARLRALEAEKLAIERASGRRPGWMLSPLGREAHERQVRATDPQTRHRLGAEYAVFLEVNDRAKEACATWQTAPDEERRHDVMAELHDVHEHVSPALAGAGEALPRFMRYGERLAAALDRAGRDPRFVVSTTVDSFHMVWFECHEDFLVTLGRSRHEEGSW